MTDVLKYVVLTVIGLLLIALFEESLRRLSMKRGRRRWQADGGPALRSKLIDQRPSALIFTGARLAVWPVMYRSRWLIIIVDASGVEALYATGETARAMVWPRIGRVLDNAAGHLVGIEDRGGGGLVIAPITDDRETASKELRQEVARRIRAKHPPGGTPPA